MDHTVSNHGHTTAELQKPNTGAIWRTFWILLIATSVEFVVAFMMISPEMKLLRISIFLGLTIVKAFYIVGEFMHLKHEVKFLIWSILIPTLFVVWFVIALMMEGGSILQSH
jgi:cytochrome c oxidase subunit IV